MEAGLVVTESIPLRMVDENDVHSFADLDGDGWLDIVRTSRIGIFAWRNRRDGTFERAEDDWGLAEDTSDHVAVAADVDGDSALDLLLGGTAGASIYRNVGGVFARDADALDGIDLPFARTAAFGDYDLDGDLDLFVALARNVEGVGRLLRNDGLGHFEDVTAGSALDFMGAPPHPGGVLPFQAMWLDYDDDGDPDLALVHDKGPLVPITNQLFRNDDGVLVDVTIHARFDYLIYGMGMCAGDVDDNGHLDVYITNIADTPALGVGNLLFLNRGDGTMYESAGPWGVSAFHYGWGCGMADFDADGDLDIVAVGGERRVGYPANQIFENLRTTFREESGRSGLPQSEHEAYAMSLGDFDRDGDIDYLTNYLDAQPIQLVRNESASGHWLGLRFAARPPNTHGIGLRVRARVNGREVLREVAAGSGFGGADAPEVLLGLGDAQCAERVTIEWPRGEPTVLECVCGDRWLRLEQL